MKEVLRVIRYNDVGRWGRVYMEGKRFNFSEAFSKRQTHSEYGRMWPKRM
jgi:hypothetical protein